MDIIKESKIHDNHNFSRLIFLFIVHKICKMLINDNPYIKYEIGARMSYNPLPLYLFERLKGKSCHSVATLTC